MYLPASSRVTSWRPRGNAIGLSNRHFQPRLVTGAVDLLAQPFHDELDGLRGEVAPGLELGQELLLRVSSEIFPYCAPGSRALSGEFLADKQVSGMALLKRDPEG